MVFIDLVVKALTLGDDAWSSDTDDTPVTDHVTVEGGGFVASP